MKENNMRGKELLSAFLRPEPLYKKPMHLPMHWTSPCEANRETQSELPSEIFCVYLSKLAQLL